MLARAERTENITVVAPGYWPDPYSSDYKVCYTNATYSSAAKTCCDELKANSTQATGGVTNCLLRQDKNGDQFTTWSKCLQNVTHATQKEIQWNCQQGAAVGLRLGLGGMLAIVATIALGAISV